MHLSSSSSSWSTCSFVLLVALHRRRRRRRRWLVVGSSVVCMHVSASAAASVAPRCDATRRLERDELYIIVAPGDAARSTGTSSGSGLLFLRRNRERWSSGTMEKEVQWETGNDIERKREKTESEKEGERGESGILHSSAGLDGREYGYYRWDAFWNCSSFGPLSPLATPPLHLHLHILPPPPPPWRSALLGGCNYLRACV